MQFDHKYYIPCLRWKQGEYQAISQFNNSIKNNLIPLIEVPEIGWDFGKKREVKTVDEQIEPFSKRVFDKWGQAPCFIDMHYIGFSKLMLDGTHPARFIFDGLREKNCFAIPTIYLDNDNAYQQEIRLILEKDKKGVCLRMSIEQASKQTLKKDIDVLLKNLEIQLNEIHLMLDIGAPNFIPLVGFVKLIKKIVNDIPHLDDWKTFSVIGTSFPESMRGIEKGITILPRYEWILYKEIIKDFIKEKLRLPAFGDYVINHPNILKLDMRLIKPVAAIRYTIDDMWCIVKGKNIRENGLEQYRDLSKMLISTQYYFGPQFSYGDEFIEKCALEKTKKAGNLTTWRKVGTNHHIKKIVLDVANFYVS